MRQRTVMGVEQEQAIGSRAIASAESLSTALEQAKVKILAAALDGPELPELRTREDIAPGTLVLVTPPGLDVLLIDVRPPNSLIADCAADWSTIAFFAERVAKSPGRAAPCHGTVPIGSSPGTAAWWWASTRAWPMANALAAAVGAGANQKPSASAVAQCTRAANSASIAGPFAPKSLHVLEAGPRTLKAAGAGRALEVIGVPSARAPVHPCR